MSYFRVQKYKIIFGKYLINTCWDAYKESFSTKVLVWCLSFIKRLLLAASVVKKTPEAVSWWLCHWLGMLLWYLRNHKSCQSNEDLKVYWQSSDFIVSGEKHSLDSFSIITSLQSSTVSPFTSCYFQGSSESTKYISKCT